MAAPRRSTTQPSSRHANAPKPPPAAAPKPPPAASGPPGPSAPPQAPPPPSREAVKVWQGIFNGGPYTALKMVQYIVQASGNSTAKFVAEPVNTTKGVTNRVIATRNIRDMAPVWAYNTGRCTSFAIKAAYELGRYADRDGKPIYNFAIYDLEGHRIARCLQTATVIDSSSTISGGAFVLPEGHWQSFEETAARWKFKSSESSFERDGNVSGKVARSSGALSHEEAMIMCLNGVESSIKYSIPTLFRSVPLNGTAQYHGLITWIPHKRCIDLVPDMKYKKRKFVIQWAKPDHKGRVDENNLGNENDLAICVTTMEDFVKVHGGPYGEAQWAADGINVFSGEMFAAAVELWGFPKLNNFLNAPA
ncbi:uncharacterized protein C8A04DRAFT_32687 [Dichotomopilus funicola]|uniref:Uncharacterized protein n=1 Tax=Dichotomopilus funicola TaxID=1934379 RepID=A0AAN6ZHW3_9PEZI|nr:hypothetical protein C8A04DRAFT_32687 [Dichotomopilus funicola]